MSLGLLRAAWSPGNEVCVARAVTRQREVLLIQQASWVQRMQKALVQMNLQLAEVLSDITGTTGQAIIRAIVAGERDPKVLASFRNSRVKRSTDEIAKALTGMREHLMQILAALRDHQNPMDVDRARAVAQVAGVLVDSAKVEVDYIKATARPAIPVHFAAE
ncbi:hypothetical protein SAMN05192544_104272 [Paraburkholderia hospita]|nr:hypothetical protein SAMN05192544_104272 [Paraburkholderia hospita]